MMEMDDCERVIRLCRDYKNSKEAAVDLRQEIVRATLRRQGAANAQPFPADRTPADFAHAAILFRLQSAVFQRKALEIKMVDKVVDAYGDVSGICFYPCSTKRTRIMSMNGYASREIRRLPRLAVFPKRRAGKWRNGWRQRKYTAPSWD